MSKLTYWKIPVEGDSDCYSLRFKTKSEAMQTWKNLVESGDAYQSPGHDGGLEWNNYAPPHKVEVEYSGGVFGLLLELTGEARNGW
tara:strand:- start:334 stop:591 length:258 start_codon:yes stop_codon:yes gene_type:complete